MINYVSANIIDILGGKIEEFLSPGLRYEFLRENKTWTVPLILQFVILSLTDFYICDNFIHIRPFLLKTLCTLLGAVQFFTLFFPCSISFVVFLFFVI